MVAVAAIAATEAIVETVETVVIAATVETAVVIKADAAVIAARRHRPRPRLSNNQV